MSYAYINQSVGKNAKNNHQDVMSIQIRLNRWVMENKLPNIPMLAVDGDCGGQTKKAIGAFQKLYVGMNNPDCRVDPGGNTLDKLFQSLISPQASKEAYEAWLKSQGASGTANTNKPAVDWNLSAAEVAVIRKDWGEEILAWVRIPPNGTESKEFFPQRRSDIYATIFVWKSLTPNTVCVPNPKQRIQFLAMLREDMPFWQQRAKGHQMAINLQHVAATSIRDYRQYVINQKMCPTAAYNRLASIGKDLIFQMIVGWFQVMSPVGLAGASASTGVFADGLGKLTEQLKKLLEGK